MNKKIEQNFAFSMMSSKRIWNHIKNNIFGCVFLQILKKTFKLIEFFCKPLFKMVAFVKCCAFCGFLYKKQCISIAKMNVFETMATKITKTHFGVH